MNTANMICHDVSDLHVAVLLKIEEQIDDHFDVEYDFDTDELQLTGPLCLETGYAGELFTLVVSCKDGNLYLSLSPKDFRDSRGNAKWAAPLHGSSNILEIREVEEAVILTSQALLILQGIDDTDLPFQLTFNAGHMQLLYLCEILCQRFRQQTFELADQKCGSQLRATLADLGISKVLPFEF